MLFLVHRLLRLSMRKGIVNDMHLPALLIPVLLLFIICPPGWDKLRYIPEYAPVPRFIYIDICWYNGRGVV